MKTLNFSILILTILLNLNHTAYAQQDNLNTKFSQKSMFLFNSFENGVAYFNDGSISKAKLNYNVVTNEICYLDNNQILVITDLEELDSIQIGTKTFYYINNQIFESLSASQISVLQNRKANLTSDKPSGAYGTESSTSAVSKKTSFYTGKGIWGGEYCNIHDESEIEIPVVENFYFLIHEEMILATKSRIFKHFKADKNSIKEFIQKNNIDFKNKEHLFVLSTFIENLL